MSCDGKMFEVLRNGQMSVKESGKSQGRWGSEVRKVWFQREKAFREPQQTAILTANREANGIWKCCQWASKKARESSQK